MYSKDMQRHGFNSDRGCALVNVGYMTLNFSDG